MALDFTAKRINWVKRLFTYLYGTPVQGATVASGLLPGIQAVQAWLVEGVTCGFLATSGSPTYPVVDSDFAGMPAVNKDIFMSVVGGFTTLNADSNFIAVVTGLLQMRP